MFWLLIVALVAALIYGAIWAGTYGSTNCAFNTTKQWQWFPPKWTCQLNGFH
jgi:hypothetical protein